ncbi:MAG: phage major capsid protein [Candidatus Hodarchaeales archaeon]
MSAKDELKKKLAEIDELRKQLEEEEEAPKEEETEEAVEETEEETEETEEEVEEAVEKVVKKIEKKLNLKELKEKLDELAGRRPDMASKLYTPVDVRKGVDSLSKEEKIVGFFQALVNGDHAVLKALSEGVAADGGYLFPDEFRAELIKDLEDPHHMRGLVRVVPMKRDVMKIPKLGSKPKVTWTSENATKSTTTADFSEKTLTAYKVAAILYASEELVEDCDTFDVVRLIISLFAEAIRDEEDKVITAGSGTGQPTGLTNCSIGSVACSGNLDFDDIINLIYLLPSKYRANAKFLVHNTNIKELRKIKDSQNRYIWQEAVAPGQPATIYGYPVIENNWLPESEIYFGDYKRGYWLGDRKRMTVTISREAGDAWEKDQVGIRVVERIAGNCVLENAIRKLTGIP